MDLFSNFCNICYKTDDGSLKDISEENMKNLKDTLITFVGHADILNHNILKLCQLCCEELSRSNKFREKCLNNLIQLRKRVFDMKSKLELENVATSVQNTLQIFVHEVVQGRNTLEESNRPISNPADNNEIVKCSADLNKRNSTFSRQIINLQSGTNECAPEFRETQVSFTHEELYMQNEMLRHSEGTAVEDFERETSQVHCAGIVNSGIEYTPETLHVKQENCSSEDSELGTNEDKLNDRLKFGFEIVTVKEECEKSITNEINSSYDEKISSGDYSNQSTVAMLDTQLSPKVWEYDDGCCPTALQSDANKRIYPDEEAHTCAVCNKTFKTRSYLLRHEQRHSGARPHKCTVCNKAFAASHSLIIHERTHSGDKPYKCTVCNMAFTQSTNLTTHERIHSGDKPYKCTVCNKAFTQLSNLTTHKRTHTGDKQFKCTICNRAFSQFHYFTVHQRIHTGVKPYKCNVCYKEFTSSSNLIVHERTHSGDRPYECTVCSTTFRTSSDLTRHKRIHNGDRPFQCTVCNKTFTESGSLTKHKRIHTGDKPHKCSVCDRAFTDLSSLIRHKRTHIGDRPINETAKQSSFLTTDAPV